MKRIFFIFCIVFFGTLTCFSQVERSERSEDTLRYLMPKITQNWFVSAYGSINWWQGSDRNPIGNYTSLNGPTFGGGVAVGKWFTHRSAFRLAYDVNRSHSYIDGLHPTLSGPQMLLGDNPTPDENGYYTTSFVYHNFHGDFLFSPIEMFTDYYDPDRIYTPIPFIGMGVACVSGYASMIKSLRDGRRNFELSADIGFINQIRLTKNLDLNITLIFTAQEYHIDSWYCEYTDNNLRPRFADFNYAITAGLTWHSNYYIYELPFKYVEVVKETTEIVQHIHDTVPCQEIAGIHGADTITEIVSFPLSVFFYKDKHELMSNRDRVNLEEIAKVAIANGWTIHLRGSCDSATATPEYNQALAKRRCNTVMNILLEMGVPEDQIEIEPVGGVKELDPTEYDRRVLITLHKAIKQ